MISTGWVRTSRPTAASDAKPPPQTLVEIEDIADRVGYHLRAILKRHGLLDEQDEPGQLDALGQCTLHALNPPTRARAQPAATADDDDGYADPQGGLAVTVEGVNLHVSSRIPGHDRDALERVCRYLLRAPLTLARLSMPDDDTLLCQLKEPDRRGRTALVLTPHELIERLCALLPAPRFPLRRAFGLLASGAPLRRLVIPAPSPRCKHRRPTDKPPPPTSSYRLDWATLLRRTFGFTGLDCQACGGPMKPIAAIERPDEVRRYLAHLGLPTELPRAARARAPPAQAA
jgi:hypothetical protein